MADLADFEAFVPRDNGLVVMTVIGSGHQWSTAG